MQTVLIDNDCTIGYNLLCNFGGYGNMMNTKKSFLITIIIILLLIVTTLVVVLVSGGKDKEKN